MPFSYHDKVLIQSLYEAKGYSSRKLINEFPQKRWKRRGLDELLKKIRETGSVDRRDGSGRPRTSRTEDNVHAVEDLIVSQEDKPQSHRSTRQISRETGIPQTTVRRIVRHDLGLKCLKRRRAHELTAANKLSRVTRSKQLLRRFSTADTAFIWFTDEKVFTVAAPSNKQNDRLYAPLNTPKKHVAPERLLRERPTFSKSVMVSVGVSKLGCTELIFVEPGVKVNGAYYRDVLLTQNLLPVMKHIAPNTFVFQQDGAPAHRARETVELLRRETPDFISPDQWPANSPDLNPVDYEIWGVMQERVYQTKVRDVDELRQRLLNVWHSIDQRVIDTAIDQWRARLKACVRAKGGHFEQML